MVGAIQVKDSLDRIPEDFADILSDWQRVI